MSNAGLFRVVSNANFASKTSLELPYEIRWKRLLDLGLSVLLLPVLCPMIAGLYLLVRCGGGPGFYGHVRVGKEGRRFHCWKLRTMVPGADDMLPELLASQSALQAEWERDCKLARDPRITRLGHLLRRSGLDELPQIWNVLRGDMSLVGPRPVTADELVRYGEARSTYEALRPGVTGLWQVSGRNALSYETRIALDLRYAARVSPQGDVALLLRTLVVFFSRNGC